MFVDKNNPSMAELVNWFQVNFTELANSMKESKHAAVDNEPNPYHLEDDVFTHTMMVCLQAEMDHGNKINKICALLHDTGKPLARDVIPFNKPKPTHTPSNELREADKVNSKTKELGREWKTHFRGHEGISFYKAQDVLKKLNDEGVVSAKEIEEILTIISLHGTLFDSIRDGQEFKPEKVAKKWANKTEAFKNFVRQVRYDSTGRFSPHQDARTAIGSNLGTTLYGDAFADALTEEYKGTQVLPKNSITVLVGVPLSGKSTWIAENVYGDTVVISRDATLMEFGQLKYGTEMCPKCNGAKDTECDCAQGKVKLTYSDIWKKFTDDDQKTVDKMIRNQYDIAIASGLDIVIDMTNTSKKSRGKWLNNINKDYYKRAVVFATGFDEIMKRNKQRNEATGKFIPEYVIVNMMKAFMVPMHDEVDHLTFVQDFHYGHSLK